MSLISLDKSRCKISALYKPSDQIILIRYYFCYRIRQIRDQNLEMPADFSNELCKWGLECEYAERCGNEQYDNLRQYGRGGSVIPSSRVSMYKVLNQYAWRKQFHLLSSMIRVGSMWHIITYFLQYQFDFHFKLKFEVMEYTPCSSWNSLYNELFKITRSRIS